MLSGSSTNGFETDLGARVRTLRRERGLTLKGLGRLAGLSHPFLSQVERGTRPPERRLGRAHRRRPGRLGRPALGARHAAATPSASCAPTRATSSERDGASLRELPGEPARPSCASGPPAPAAGPRSPRSSAARSRSTSPAVRVEVDLDGVVHALDEGDTLRFDGVDPAPPAPHRRHRHPRPDRHFVKGPALRPVGELGAEGRRRRAGASAARLSAAIATPIGPGPVAHARRSRAAPARPASARRRRRTR